MKKILNLKNITYLSAIILIINLFCGIFAENIVADKELSAKREIAADSMKWEYEAGIAVFTGNVTMKDDEGEIRCLKMTTLFDDNDEIEKILAEENATLSREKQKGGAEIIEIYPDKNLIVLKQNAWISSDKATFQGEEIVFDTEKEIINITKGVKGEIRTGNEEDRNTIDIR